MRGANAPIANSKWIRGFFAALPFLNGWQTG